ncbi:putative bifunctional diguanylate cyclase/phosphodiesterase [Actinoplanes sp. NPDC049668]|uniref:putative bifunctional diguanylate cyclase/phosphodiesterase n=1 Tax=unclassified Actinoplanes TaxID=2626549 RepID=UPI0033AA277E
MLRSYLGLGFLIVAAVPVAPPAVRGGLYISMAVVVLAALVTGIRLHRPAWSRPWWLMVATIGMSVLANLGWSMATTPAGVVRFPSLGDLSYALSMCLLITSAYWWIRPGRYRGGRIDAAIALAGGGAVAWVIILDPMLFGDRFSGLRLGAYLCYVVLDLLMVALTVRVAVVSRVRTAAYRLMVSAATLWVVTDTVYYSAQAVGAAQVARWASTAGLVAYLLIGAAALHPSMARSTGSMPRNAAPLSRGRLAGYLTLTVVIAGLSVFGVATLLPGQQTLRLSVVLCLGCVTSVLLIARLAQLGAALNRRAYIDPLTGLGNRAFLQNHLHRRANHDQALLVMDLDGFREINAAFGHPAGDAVLVESGHRLRAAAPGDAVVVRLDADSFAVLTRGDEEQLRGLVQRLLRSIAEPYPVAGLTSRRVQASVGAVTIAAGGDLTTALRDADLALQDARAVGNGLSIFDPSAYARWRANRDLVADLQRAIGAGEFGMHYQPIVDLGTGGIVAAEALLRWTRADGTPVSPAHFIPLAEQSGEITVIGDWVLDQVCADLAGLWRAHRVPVTVNVSAHQLRDAGFADRLLSRLDAVGLPGESLIVEITETVLITTVTDAATTIAQLQQLRDHGVRIAVDDFGTGYSSLAYLRELPVDILKMDGSFTSHQIEDGSPREIAFVRTIVALGRSLNLLTLAEAVETPGQAERLRHIGCHLAQGYHFARPAPIGVLHDLLATNEPTSLDLSAAL